MDFDQNGRDTRDVAWAGPASLVCGVLALGFELAVCFVPMVSIFVFVLAVVAIGCGALALSRGRDSTENRVLGATGLVLGLVNVIGSLGLLLIQVGAFAMLLGFYLMD